MIYAAIMGYGVVGSGVAEVLDVNKNLITKRTGDEIYVKHILDIRDFPGDKFENRITHDFDIILNDPEVSIVAEVMGGVGKAYEFTLKLLNAGKSVVTSNKELVAAHGDELLSIAAKNNVRYMFEASVGGGIPIITPLEDSLAANEITEIYGIVNGTSNYILTSMKNGKTFEEALADAQAKGYAEKDPTADIEGHDSCRKICILAAMVFGVLFDPSMVPTRGISSVTLEQVEKAENDGYSVKLIARAVKTSDGKISLSVAPTKVKKSNPLAGIEGVYNGIIVSGNSVGDVMFYGQGAGSLPTASAVVADIIHIASHSNKQNVTLNWIRDNSLFTESVTSPADLERMKEKLGEVLC